MYVSVGDSLVTEKQYANSNEFYQIAIEQLKEKNEWTAIIPLVIKWSNNLIRLGESHQAIQLLSTYIGIATIRLNEHHPLTALLLHKTGAVYYRIKDIPQALQFYKKALAIREQVLEKQHPDITKSLHNICLLYTSPSPRDATLSRMPSSA